MPLSNVTVNKGASGLGRRLLSDDGIAGFIFYNNTLPSGFATDDRVKKVFSLSEAESLGVVDTSADHEVDHYHVSEFFRLNPNGSLWLGYYAVPAGSYDYDEIVQMNNTTKGEIRIYGIYTPLEAFASASITAVQAKMTEINVLNTPALAFLCANIEAVADLSTLTDLRTLNAPDVGAIIAEDNAGTAAALHTAKSYSITAMGSVLGALSSASVQQSPANPENFNLSGVEMTVPGYANGQAYRDLTATASGAIKDKAYVIVRDYLPGISGTFVERMPLCVPSSNDYAFEENRRVVQKVQRLYVTAYTPKLNSNILLDSEGQLSDETVEALKDIGDTQLEGMRAVQEISDGVTKIDPSQDILSTSNLLVSVDVLPVGVSEFITININLVPQL